MSETRKLAVILVADIVGYSRGHIQGRRSQGVGGDKEPCQLFRLVPALPKQPASRGELSLWTPSFSRRRVRHDQADREVVYEAGLHDANAEAGAGDRRPYAGGIVQCAKISLFIRYAGRQDELPDKYRKYAYSLPPKLIIPRRMKLAEEPEDLWPSGKS